MRGATTWLAVALAALVGIGGYAIYAQRSAKTQIAALTKEKQLLQQDAAKYQQDVAASAAEADRLRRALGGIQATTAKRPGTDKPEAVAEAFFQELVAGHVDAARLYLEKDSLLPQVWLQGVTSTFIVKSDASDTGATVYARVRTKDDQVASWTLTVAQRNDMNGRRLWAIIGISQTLPGS